MLRPPTKFTKTFGRVLRSLRLERELSQESLGHRSGIHPTVVSEIERGVTVPSLRTIEMLAKALDMRPHALVKAAEDALDRKTQVDRK